MKRFLVQTIIAVALCTVTHAARSINQTQKIASAVIITGICTGILTGVWFMIRETFFSVVKTVVHK